jgi:acyl carrier protein
MNQDISPLATKILHLIRLELLETHPDFGIDSNLFDAGLDSMAIMQLSLLVERDFGISIPETRIVKATFSSAKSLAQVLVQLGASPS